MKRKIVSIFLVVVLLGMCMIPIAYAKSATQRKKELEGQLNEAKEQKEEVTSEKKSVLKEIDKLNAQIDDYEIQIKELNTKISKLKKSIASKEIEIKKLEKEYSEKEEAFIERMVAIYEAGQTTYLDVLLSSDSVVSFISNYYMISELAEADNAMMEAIQNQQQKIEDTKRELENEKKEITTSRNAVEAKTNSLNSTKSAKQSKVNSLSAKEKELQATMDKFTADIKKAQKEIDEAVKKANQSSGGNQYVGSFSGTLSWPISTSSWCWNYISSGYGRRTSPTAGASTNHKALDIAVGYNTTVYAPADGYVVIASRQSGYGNFIMIKHSNNLYTCYGHLNSYKVSAGQTVKRGQAIALSGSTGVSTGPHLHWEVRTSSSYSSRVNPLNYISNSVYSKLDFHC